MTARAVIDDLARLALAATSDAVYVLDRDWRFRYVNDAAALVLERNRVDLLGAQVWTEFPGAVGSPIEAHYRHAAESGEPVAFEEYYAPLDHWFEIRAFPSAWGLTVFFRDIDDRRRREDDTEARAEATTAILNALPSPTVLVDRTGTVRRTNRAWDAEAAAGWAPASGEAYLSAGRPLCPREDAQVRAALHAVAHGDLDRFTMDYEAGRGEGRRWIHLQATPVEAERGIVVVHTDVTDRVRAQQVAAAQARRDALTGLPNRAHLLAVLGDALAEGGDIGRVAVLFLDLDGFKDVNDALGHDSGDSLLRHVAARLHATMGPTDVVGRLGGDEFVVVARDRDGSEAEALAAAVHGALAEPFEVGGMCLPLSASIGIATPRAPVPAPEALLTDADVAMYAAKAAGRARTRTFTEELRRRADERLAVVEGLGRALREGELVFHYQPIVDLRTGRIGDAEALMRWQHPRHGLLAPAAFIPVAEETGFIVEMTRWALRAVAAQAVCWQDEGLDLAVGVNISAVHLAAGTLVEDVRVALRETGLAPDRLVVELTETAMAGDSATASAQLVALRTLGLRVAIDDFGVGYSSLGRLAEYPVDCIKLDGSLLRPVSDERQRAVLQGIVEAVVSIASLIDVEILAEGVETDEQLAVARDLGCHFAQGYGLGRPVPAPDLAALLRAQG